MCKSTGINWEQYEEVTKFIYENLGARDGITIKGYGRKFKVIGKSGVKHQIDVMTEQRDGDRCHLTAIECKCVKKKVTKDVVMRLREIMDDAEIESGIIVCKTGYTKDTLKFAEHRGIKLVQLWEAGENDMGGMHTINVGNLDLNINTTLLRPIITNIDLGNKLMTDQNEINAMHYVTMFDANGKEVYFNTCLREFCNDLHAEEVLLKSVTRIYIPSGGKLTWTIKGEELVIRRILITGFLTRKDSSLTKSFQIVDQIWMIMNEVFEKRRTTLAKSGLMYNLPQDF